MFPCTKLPFWYIFVDPEPSLVHLESGCFALFPCSSLAFTSLSLAYQLDFSIHVCEPVLLSFLEADSYWLISCRCVVAAAAAAAAGGSFAAAAVVGGGEWVDGWVGWLAGCLDGWLAGWLLAWLAGWLVGGWLLW